MDGDEVFAMLACSVLAVWAAVRWYGNLLRVTSLASSSPHRWFLAGVPLVCLVIVQFILSCCAAHEVKDGFQYDLLFLAGAVAWLAFATFSLPLVGLSGRDDAVETHNSAAVAAISGAWLGVTLCYAGGNIGEGATIWMTFAPAALATLALLALWLILELLTEVSEAIAIDRDLASGLRLAGFLMASGLILGRSVAGDWHSWGDTLHDFYVQGWPALPLIVVAAFFQHVWRPGPKTPNHHVRSRGWWPAGALVLAATSYVILLGRPEHATAVR